MPSERYFDIPPPYRYRALAASLLVAGLMFDAGFALIAAGLEFTRENPSIKFFLVQLFTYALYALPLGALAALLGALPAYFIGHWLVREQKFGFWHFIFGGIAAGLPPVILLAPIFFGVMLGLYLPVTVLAGSAGGWAARAYLLGMHQIPRP